VRRASGSARTKSQRSPPPLQVDQHVADLRLAQLLDRQRPAVFAVDLLAERRADDTDVAGRLGHADDVLQAAGQLPEHGAHEDVAVEAQVGLADLPHCHHRCSLPFVVDGDSGYGAG
jgi:hypothetical protein